MSLEKTLMIKGNESLFYPIIQEGMGAGVSLMNLATAVGLEGCIGTVSSAALDKFVSKRIDSVLNMYEATKREIEDVKKKAGVVAINVMCALNHYEETIRGAVEGGVDMIISGAGLPRSLSNLVEKYAGKDHKISLVPKISSGVATELMIRMWDKKGYVPDAFVLEGPKAGGHLGWSYKQIKEAGKKFLEKYDLFKVLLPEVLAVLDKYKLKIPVFVAGGIYDQKDVKHALSQGAEGVAMGTRFVTTNESDASEEFKQAYIDSKEEDITVATEEWGSPCNYPFRYIKQSPLFRERKGNYFCICSGLLTAAKLGEPREGSCPEKYVKPKDSNCPAFGNADYKGIYTCGTEAARVDKIMTVKELVRELVE